MSVLATIWREALGLFVDDGSLAAGIILWVAAMALAVRLGLSPGLAAAVFGAGLLALLVENVIRAARRRGTAGHPPV